jgi:hypothetical protein
MDIKRKIKIIQDRVMVVENGLRKIYVEIFKKNRGKANKATESMVEILRTAEDLKKKVSQFLTDFKLDSS